MESKSNKQLFFISFFIVFVVLFLIISTYLVVDRVLISNNIEKGNGSEETMQKIPNEEEINPPVEEPTFKIIAVPKANYYSSINTG